MPCRQYVYFRRMDKDDYRRRRQYLGLTQVQLAQLLGVHPRTITRREAGYPISMEAALAIRDLCEMEEKFADPSDLEFHLLETESRFRGDESFQAYLAELDLNEKSRKG